MLRRRGAKHSGGSVALGGSVAGSQASSWTGTTRSRMFGEATLAEVAVARRDALAEARGAFVRSIGNPKARLPPAVADHTCEDEGGTWPAAKLGLSVHKG